MLYMQFPQELQLSDKHRAYSLTMTDVELSDLGYGQSVAQDSSLRAP